MYVLKTCEPALLYVLFCFWGCVDRFPSASLRISTHSCLQGLDVQTDEGCRMGRQFMPQKHTEIHTHTNTRRRRIDFGIVWQEIIGGMCSSESGDVSYFWSVCSASCCHLVFSRSF